MKIKSLFKNLFLLLIVIFVFFFFVEIGVRLLAPENKKLFHFNEIIGPIRIPETEFIERTKEFGTLVHRTNSLGFIDSEHKLEKDENVYRIIFLGDSFTEAIQIPLEKTFYKEFEKKLNNSNLGKRFEVINLGLAGFATDQEYLTLKEFGFKYAPDLIVLMSFPANDVFFNSLLLSNEPSKPYFDLVNGSLEQIQQPEPIIENKLILFLTDHFQSPRFFYKKFNLLISKIKATKNRYADEGGFSKQWYVYAEKYNSDWEKGWQITDALIKEIADNSEERESEFLLVYIPEPVEVSSKWWESTLSAYPAMKNVEWDLEKPSRILNEFSQQENINYLDLLPIFRQNVTETGQDLYLDHFNSQGHQLTADSIYKFLIDNNLLKL